MGNEWKEGVIGAAVGGAVYGGVLASTANIAAAGFSSAAAESIVNEALSYTPLSKYNGTEQKELTVSNVFDSVERVISDTIFNGTTSLILGIAVGKLFPLNGLVSKIFANGTLGNLVKNNIQTLIQNTITNFTLNLWDEFTQNTKNDIWA